MIPKASHDAVEESFMRIGKSLNDLNSETPEMAKKQIEKIILEFKEKQPKIFEQLSYIFSFHMEHTEGLCHIQQLTLYVILVVNSLYIQEEMNTIKKLFDTPSDNSGPFEGLDEEDKKDPEEPEDLL